MRILIISSGRCTLVDDEEYRFLTQWNWSYDSSTGYAYRCQHLPSSRKEQKSNKIYMHRLINKTPKGLVTDHINRNKLDNRRKNLRSVTISQNLVNRGKQANNSSGYKGISWSKRDSLWIAGLVVRGETKLKKSFKNLDDALNARKEAEAVYHV